MALGCLASNLACVLINALNTPGAGPCNFPNSSRQGLYVGGGTLVKDKFGQFWLIKRKKSGAEIQITEGYESKARFVIFSKL
jgi:hypothetical protein